MSKNSRGQRSEVRGQQVEEVPMPVLPPSVTSSVATLQDPVDQDASPDVAIAAAIVADGDGIQKEGFHVPADGVMRTFTLEGATGRLQATATDFAIWLPIGDVGNGYRTRHLDVQLDTRQAEAAKYLFDSLNGKATKLASGRYVASAADAVRWLLEQVAAGVDRLSPAAAS